MNHHRAGITALVLLCLITGIFFYVEYFSKDRLASDTYQLPFDGIVPSEIVLGDTSKRQVIFTFDAGAGNASVLRILEILRKHNVKGTFFMTGQWALRNTDFARKIVAGGHEVFNHSYSHPYLTEISDLEINRELSTMDSVFKDITGTSTKPYFRPPFGDRDARVLRLAAQTGFRSVYWTIDARDWMESEGVTADEVKNRILENLQPGMIVLMHVGDTITGVILDDIFATIEKQGYKIVSLTQGI